MSNRKNRRRAAHSGWDGLADWYAGWVGADGSEHHRDVAIPAVLDLLEARTGETVLDVGCGTGALSAHVRRAGAHYTGIDASPRMVAFARRHHRRHGRFLVLDATAPGLDDTLGRAAFDAAVFLLSIQDIDPLRTTVDRVATLLRDGGRVVVLMTHPCFRVPRQSGWGWDNGRRLRFRRVDSYLTPLAVPMKRYGEGNRRVTRSHHRPLEHYVEAFGSAGLLLDRLREIPYHRAAQGEARPRAERRADGEIPLFLGLRAVKRGRA